MRAVCDHCYMRGVITEATVKFAGAFYCSFHAKWVLGPLPAVMAAKVPA